MRTKHIHVLSSLVLPVLCNTLAQQCYRNCNQYSNILFFLWSHHQTNSQFQSNLFHTNTTDACINPWCISHFRVVSANRSWVSWRCRSVVLNTRQRPYTLRQSRSNHAWGQYLPLTVWKLVQIPRQKRGLLYNV